MKVPKLENRNEEQILKIIHICHIYRTSVQSLLLHNPAPLKFWLLQTTLQVSDCTIVIFCSSVTLSDGQGQSNTYQTVKFNGACHHVKFERNWLMNIQIKANIIVYEIA